MDFFLVVLMACSSTVNLVVSDLFCKHTTNPKSYFSAVTKHPVDESGKAAKVSVRPDKLASTHGTVAFHSVESSQPASSTAMKISVAEIIPTSTPKSSAIGR